jgi:hypothetical protein
MAVHVVPELNGHVHSYRSGTIGYMYHDNEYVLINISSIVHHHGTKIYSHINWYIMSVPPSFQAWNHKGGGKSDISVEGCCICLRNPNPPNHYRSISPQILIIMSRKFTCTSTNILFWCPPIFTPVFKKGAACHQFELLIVVCSNSTNPKQMQLYIFLIFWHNSTKNHPRVDSNIITMQSDCYASIHKGVVDHQYSWLVVAFTNSTHPEPITLAYLLNFLS